MKGSIAAVTLECRLKRKAQHTHRQRMAELPPPLTGKPKEATKNRGVVVKPGARKRRLKREKERLSRK